MSKINPQSHQGKKISCLREQKSDNFVACVIFGCFAFSNGIAILDLESISLLVKYTLKQLEQNKA